MILVAGGSGRRLGADVPKAFVTLGDEPMVVMSARVFDRSALVSGVALVVPEGWIEVAGRIVEDASLSKPVTVVSGGATRAGSVRSGLAAVPVACGRVLVHDAARPFVAHATVAAVCSALDGEVDGAVPAVPVIDTIKRVDGAGFIVETPPRSSLFAAQTPQGFPRRALERAFSLAVTLDGVTDCSSMVEAAGGRVAIIDGDPGNVKITTEVDLAVARRRVGERDA